MTAVMARRRRAAALPQAEPNVIPFIDVLLVLLIIFMVTAPKPTTDLRLDLPRPGPSEPVVIPPTIVDIRAAPGGGYRAFISGEEVPVEGLAAGALAHMLAANPVITREDALAEGRIYVRADLDIAYQHVITAVEALQQARFQRVAIYAQSADDV